MISNDAEIQKLLDCIAVIRLARDLDLLLFCSRHSRALLTPEQLAAFLGYDPNDVAATVDTMLAAGALKRVGHQAHRLGMYIFETGTGAGEPLTALLPIASSRLGRLAILQALDRSARDKRKA